MGNCLRHESTMSWAGEDWGSSPLTDYDDKAARRRLRKKQTAASDEDQESLLEETEKISFRSSSSSSSSSDRVKIRITKKQLEELMGRVELQGLTVEQMVAQLMKCHSTLHNRSWRPALQSIPEIN